MKKVLKFFLFLIILIGIAVGGYFAYLKFFAPQGDVDAFNTIPEDAVFIVETTNLSEAWTTINNSELWKHLIETEYFSEMNEDINMVNSFLDSNAVADLLLNGRKLVVSAIMASPKEWDFLYSIDLEEESGTVKRFDKLLNMMKDFKVSRNEYKTDAGKFTIITLLSKTDPDLKIYLSFADNIILVSLNGNIIEKSLKGLATEHWKNDEKFIEILEQIPQRRLFKIYVNYTKAEDFSKTFLTSDNELIAMLSNSLAFSILNFDVTSDRVILDGYANMDSVGSYAQALASVAPGKMSAYKIMTNQSAAYISIAFDDYYEFYNNLMNEYTENYPDQAKDIEKGLNLLKNVIKINVEEDLFSWIGNEIALFKIRPLSKQSKDKDIALVIHTKDLAAAQKGMSQIVKQIRKWSPFKFKEYDYKNFTINYLKQKNFFKPFLGKLFEGIDEPYFTYIQNHVVFSNSKEVLEQIIDDYIRGNTLDKDTKFKDFIYDFKIKSTISAFVMMPKMYETLYYFTPSEDRADLKKNKELIMSIARVGFQLVNKNNMFTTTVVAQYDPDAYLEDVADKINKQTESEMFTEYIDTMGFRIVIEDSINDGNYIEYFDENEQKTAIEGQVIDNQPTGLWRSYYENGNIKNAVNYENGKIVGVAYFYYNDVENTQRAEVIFEEDYIEGTYKEYYDNGARKANILYKNGERNGDAEYYYTTGNLKIKAHFKDNLKHGKWVYYDEKGDIILTEKWKKGVKKREK